MSNRNTTVLGALGALVALSTGAAAQQIYLNELYVSHSNPSADQQEFIELKGPVGTLLDNYMVLVVEGEGSLTNQGSLDRAWDLTGLSITNTGGYFLLAEPMVVGAAPTDLVIDWFGTGQDTLENGTETFYLVDAGSPANVAAILALVGTDVDSDNDGITVIPTLSTIIDIVAMVDCDYVVPPSSGVLDSVFDGATVTGPDGMCPGGFFPAGIYRGFDAPNGWCPDFLDYNAGANVAQPRTPGAQNSLCPSTPQITNYCTAGTTTNGCNATMGFLGSPSVSVGPGAFTVTCSNVEGQKTGIIFYSVAGANAVQWGSGTSFLCVKSPQQRTGANNAGGTLNGCDGSLSLDFFDYVVNVNPSAQGAPFSAGNQAWFQAWFRDPPAPKTTSLSDGLEVTMIP